MSIKEAFILSLRAAVLGTQTDEIQNMFALMESDSQDNPLLDNRFWILARRQSCAHLLSVWALDNGLLIPNPMQAKMQVYHVLQRQVRQNMLMTDLLQLYKNANLSAVVIKGYGLSLLYPKQEMRDFGDVDLYVGADNYLQATEIAKSAYPSAYWHSDTEGGIHFIIVLDTNKDRIAEIHRVTMEFASQKADKAWQDFTNKYISLGAQTIEQNGVEVVIPGCFYNFLYVFLHAWHHFESSGVGLRQLMDWVLCLRRNYELMQTGQSPLSVDEQKQIMTTLLNQLGMLDIWRTFGYVAVNYLGLNKAEMPLYTDKVKHKADKLFVQLMHEGHGGREMRARLGGQMMYFYPYARPESGRLKQKIYTLKRLVFNFVQMSKLFPHFALREFLGEVRSAMS